MSADFKETLPGELTQHVTAICGAKGEAWLDSLPDAISDLESHWDITVGSPFPGIEYNFVAEAVACDGRPVVVKVAPPFEEPEIFGEAKYLRLHNGRGAIRLLAEDKQRHAILLERAVPGLALHELFGDQPAACIRPAIELLKVVLQPPPEDMTDVPTLDGWFKKFREFRNTAFPANLAEQALDLYEHLSSQLGRTFYIHGDYHPGNIVSASREMFQVIDPKGIVGGVGYDIAVFLINLERWRRDDRGLEEFLDLAVSEFARAFGFTEREIREWVFVHMVIGAWWNFQDMPDLYDAELAMPAIWHL